VQTKFEDAEDAEAIARLDLRGELAKAAWRLLMPPVAAKRKVTILAVDQFNAATFATVLQSASDNDTSVIAIEARDFSPETAQGRVMAMARIGKQAVCKFKGSLWAGERGQACIVFHEEGQHARMRLSHSGDLRILEGSPAGDFKAGVQMAATRLLAHAKSGEEVPGCSTNYRLPN
jgi:hypothetical protein